jgi:hypothetical protein
MTMILSRKRDTFAVLAADRLIATSQGPCGEVTKLVRHTKLPLAFAVGGMMKFYLAPKYACATDHVAEFASTITSIDQLVVQDIAKLLEQRFQAAMTREKVRLQLFIALVKDGIVDVGVQIVSSLTIKEDPTELYHHDNYYVIPECIRDFCSRDPHIPAMRDPHVATPEEVGRLAREAIAAGIVQETTLHADGKNRVIGGRPDVVVVTKDGAFDLS